MSAENNPYPLVLMALCAWREARHEGAEAMAGVCHTILNRSKKPGWWGNSVVNCIRQRNQFTSMTFLGDPQLTLYPDVADPNWKTALGIAGKAIEGTLDDPTNGATYYYDATLDRNPPWWSTNGSTYHTANIGQLRFMAERPVATAPAEAEKA